MKIQIDSLHCANSHYEQQVAELKEQLLAAQANTAKHNNTSSSSRNESTSTTPQSIQRAQLQKERQKKIGEQNQEVKEGCPTTTCKK